MTYKVNTVPSVQASPPPRSPQKKPAPRKKPARPFLLWAVIVAGIASAMFIFAGLLIQGPRFEITLPGQSKPMIAFGTPGEKIILVMGVDAPSKELRDRDEDAFEGTRTDTMMLVRVDSHQKNVSVVSIPRDSKVYLAGDRGVDKINAAHALGGPELAVRTVEDSFGIPVDNFMVINFRGVRELVDAVGGIDLYIDKPMRYNDYTAKLHIDFKPGQQHLDGKQAEAFLRFRHDQLGDIGRIRRQQQFIVAVSKKLKDPRVVLKIPDLVKVANQYVETDFSFNDMMALGFFAKDVDMKNIRTATLPGRPGGTRVSYWIIEPEATQMILDRLILDNPESLNPLSRGDDSAIKIGVYYDPALKEQIETLQGALEAEGFQVVCKSPQKRTSTQIIEHTGRVTNKLTNQIRGIDPRLGGARLIFAPVGTTFENVACSASEDYTLVLGGDSI